LVDVLDALDAAFGRLEGFHGSKSKIKNQNGK